MARLAILAQKLVFCIDMCTVIKWVTINKHYVSKNRLHEIKFGDLCEIKSVTATL